MNHQLQSRSSAALPVLRLVVLVALIDAGYLLYLRYSGGVALGCGEGTAGCNEILGSRWSSVFGVPVIGLAFALYLLIFVVSVHAGPNAPDRHRMAAWRVMASAGVCAGAAALWFIGLQAFAFGEVCLFCMLAHGCSLVIAGTALWMAGNGWVHWIGVLPAAVLVALQLTIASPLPDPVPMTADVGEIDLSSTPVLGDPAAPFQIVVLYDYNCHYCRAVHEGLKQAIEDYEGRLCAYMLPTAIDPACNHSVSQMNPNSETSCELARLALAVWIANPEQYEAFDQRVIDMIDFENREETSSSIGMVQTLRVFAAHLVGRAELEAAEVSPLIDEQMHFAADIYGRAVDPETGTTGLPRILIDGRSYSGVLHPNALSELLEQRFEAP